jgi:single-strand DNA-binding protein
MNSLKNKVQLIGRLGSNPEMKTMENGNKLAKMNLATNDVYTNNRGERVEDTEWHQVVAWGKTAEIAEKYLQKGSEVMVEGKLTYREYTAKDGSKRMVTEIVVSSLMMMDKKQVA